MVPRVSSKILTASLRSQADHMRSGAGVSQCWQLVETSVLINIVLSRPSFHGIIFFVSVLLLSLIALCLWRGRVSSDSMLPLEKTFSGLWREFMERGGIELMPYSEMLLIKAYVCMCIHRQTLLCAFYTQECVVLHEKMFIWTFQSVLEDLATDPFVLTAGEL